MSNDVLMPTPEADANRACGDAPAGRSWPEWPVHALVEDVRAAAAHEIHAGRACVIATLVRADGPTPRRIGAQMLVRVDGSIEGCVSGGCIEAAVATEAHDTLQTGRAQLLMFGPGSPYLDVRLTCGSRIEIAVERLAPGDDAAEALVASAGQRKLVRWHSGLDANTRGIAVSELPDRERAKRLARRGEALAAIEGRQWWVQHLPSTRLLISGGDAVALCLATLASNAGMEVVLNRPKGPSAAPPVPLLRYSRLAPAAAVAQIAPDAWTAVVATTHDLELDEQAIIPALQSQAFYVGAMGSRRKQMERRQRLSAQGVSEAALQRLHAPVGMEIGATSPAEIAVAILADLVRSLRHE